MPGGKAQTTILAAKMYKTQTDFSIYAKVRYLNAPCYTQRKPNQNNA